MNDVSAMHALSERLCPWLGPALEHFETARAAQRLGHAWLLTGPQGVGKINLALVVAGRLLGTPATGTPPELDAQTFAAAMRARHAPADHHPDLHWIYPQEDKRTISVEQVREITEVLSLKAHRAAAKVVVIEPADGMTDAAANALLKTLEEPVGDAYLLLVSHQAGRLPATILSRCQRLVVHAPRPAMLARWLGVEDVAAIADVELSAGRSALAAAELVRGSEDVLNIKKLEAELTSISQHRIDPQRVADAWVALDHEQVLTWLLRRTQRAIRARLAPRASTVVTDPGADALHNAWQALTLRTLFGQYQAAERLLSQLGAGINVDLALRALLLGFQPDRGRP